MTPVQDILCAVVDQINGSSSFNRKTFETDSYIFDVGNKSGNSGVERWFIDFTKRLVEVHSCDIGYTAKCIITVPDVNDFVSMFHGKMNPTSAFMQGKIKVKGDMSLAMKLQVIIGAGTSNVNFARQRAIAAAMAQTDADRARLLKLVASIPVGDAFRETLLKGAHNLNDQDIQYVLESLDRVAISAGMLADQFVLLRDERLRVRAETASSDRLSLESES